MPRNLPFSKAKRGSILQMLDTQALGEVGEIMKVSIIVSILGVLRRFGGFLRARPRRLYFYPMEEQNIQMEAGERRVRQRYPTF